MEPVEIAAEIQSLSDRIDAMGQREDSTRRRLAEHESVSALRDEKIVETLTAIKMDVHEIRVSKRVILGLIVFLSGGIVLTTKWTVEHYMTDVLVHDGLLQIRRSP